MIGALIALAVATRQNPYIAACSLPSDAHFFEKLDALPDQILRDFRLNAGKVVNPGEYVNLSDVRNGSNEPTAYWRYVLQVKDMWLITYRSGGISIQDVTVAYEAAHHSATRYIGAVSGDPCAAYDYYLGKAGFTALDGWRHIDSFKSTPK
jgi:hypothetical protein